MWFPTGRNASFSSATLTNLALTTIRQPCTEIAQAAVETLEWRLLDPSTAPRRVFVSAPLVVRESTTNPIE